MSPDPHLPVTVRIQVDRGVRRRHGFIQDTNPIGSPLQPSSTDTEENLFHSSSDDLGVTSPSGHDKEEQPRRRGMRHQLPLELGSDLQSESDGVGILFVKRFLKINSILFESLTSFPTLLFLFLVLLSLLVEYVIYQVGLVPSRFYKALGQKDIDAFWSSTAIGLGIIVTMALLKSTKDYAAKLLTVNWRLILCQCLHKMYFTRIYYYQLNVLDRVIDNPDQRLTQDVDKFTKIYGEILPLFLTAPFVIAYYSYQAFTKSGWYGPVGCFSFFLLGSLVNRLAMLSIVKYVLQQEKCEGDFRFIHMLIRVNSESIAFQDGSRREGSKVDESLNQLISIQNRLYFRQFILAISINLYNYLGSILSYLILAIPIFAGVYDSLSPTDLSVIISQNSFVNMYLIYQFSQLVDLSSKIAELVGLTHRISQLIERLGELNGIWKDLFPFDGEDEARADYSQFKSSLRSHPSPPSDHKAEPVGIQSPKLIPAWELTNVSYSPPFRDTVLVSDLTLTIHVGESLLIVGGSSAGKSSLLRILRGLWPPTHGRVKRFHPPGPGGAFYCPQKPYLAVGTLREQICFPLKPSEDVNQREADAVLIVNYLKLFKLTHLVDRIGGIDAPVSWTVYESLSPGEIQRLCSLRVFFHKPLLAILDESTSALPEAMEETIYLECRRLGITTISIAHRDSVRKFHQKLLSLEVGGTWSLTDIS